MIVDVSITTLNTIIITIIERKGKRVMRNEKKSYRHRWEFAKQSDASPVRNPDGEGGP